MQDGLERKAGQVRRALKEFPGGPMVRTPRFHCPGLIPGRGTKIPQATRHSSPPKKGLECQCKWAICGLSKIMGNTKLEGAML